MVGPLEGLVSVVLALAGTVLCGATAVSWKRVTAPATDEFGTVTGVAGVGVLAVAAGVLTDPGVAVFFAVSLALLLPLPWLVFAFEYTGRTELRSPRAVVTAGTPVAIGVVSTVLIFGTRLFPWLSLPSRRTATGLVAVAVYSLTIAEWITLLYAGGVTLVGTGVLLWTFHRYEHLDATSGTLLGVFGTVPWLSLLFGFQVEAVAPLALPVTIAVGFAVGAAAVGLLLYRRQLFRRLPAAGNIGPATAIENLSDVVVVTDGEGRVIEWNRVAGRLSSEPSADVAGSDAAELLGSGPAALQETDVVELRSTEGRRLFEPAVSELTDQHDRRLGYAVVLRDVTDRTIRRQRLEVLNRVLRHNLRNDAMVVQSRARVLAERVEDPSLADHAETVAGTVQELIDRSETAREVEHLMSSADVTVRKVELSALAHETLEHVPDGAVVDHAVPDGLVVETSRDLLETALRALVENAVEHNDAEEPGVAVRAHYDPDEFYPVTVAVADDGPGIPDVEREVLQEGSETPLRHGSGLGLWLVRWTVTRLGGELDIVDRDPRGTVVSVRLPKGRMTEGTTTVTGPADEPAADGGRGHSSEP